MFSVVNMHNNHLKFYVVYIYGRRYVCCSECNIVSSEGDEPPPALCNLFVRTVVKLYTLCVLDLGVSLVSLIVMTSTCGL